MQALHDQRKVGGVSPVMHPHEANDIRVLQLTEEKAFLAKSPLYGAPFSSGDVLAHEHVVETLSDATDSVNRNLAHRPITSRTSLVACSQSLDVSQYERGKLVSGSSHCF